MLSVKVISKKENSSVERDENLKTQSHIMTQTLINSLSSLFSLILYFEGRVSRKFSVYDMTLMGFPDDSANKECAYIAGDLGSIPGLGRSPGEGNGYPLQYSGLENSMDCIVHGVAKSQTRLSDFHFTLFPYFYKHLPWAELKQRVPSESW